MSYLLDGSENLRVYTRRDWGARPARSETLQPRAPREAFLHHTTDGHAEDVRTLHAQKAAMRRIQDFHMNTRGWADISYHWIVFQPFGNIPYARIFEGRPWDVIPAAQQGHNTGTLAVCVFGDFTSDELKRNTRYAIQTLLKKHECGRALRTLGGHGDVFGTECPGKNIRRWIPRIAEQAGLEVYR